MRFLRKLFKYALRIILVLFSLVILVMILLYVPAIQNFVKGKAEQYVDENLDMKLSVGRIFHSIWPLKIFIWDRRKKTRCCMPMSFR